MNKMQKFAPTKFFKTTSKSQQTTSKTIKRLQIPKSRSTMLLASFCNPGGFASKCRISISFSLAGAESVTTFTSAKFCCLIAIFDTEVILHMDLYIIISSLLSPWSGFCSTCLDGKGYQPVRWRTRGKSYPSMVGSPTFLWNAWFWLKTIWNDSNAWFLEYRSEKVVQMASTKIFWDLEALGIYIYKYV